MYESDVDCVFFNYGPGTCQRQDKACDAKGCKDLIKTNVIEPAFTDTKWAWKTSMNLLTRVYDAFMRREQCQISNNMKLRKACYKRGHFHFIARETEPLLRMLIHLRSHFGEQRKKIKFLDCGCGIGNVVILARFAGFDAYGVEYDKQTLKRGKEVLPLFGVESSKLHQGDLLEYPDFDKYDVLYGYCPMSHGGKERTFEKKLYKDMKIGAMLIGIGAGKREQVGRNEYVYFQRLRIYRGYEYSSANPNVKVAHEKQ